MKLNLNLFAAVFLVLLSVGLVSAQDKTLDGDAYSAIVSRANSSLNGKIYRTKETYETFADRSSTPTKSIITVSERVPPNRSRWTIETEGMKTEYIRIDAKLYKRENGGSWELQTASGFGAGMGCSAGQTTTTYKTVENEKFDGKTVNLYEKVEKLTGVSCGDSSKTQIWTEKYWVSKEGVLLKTERLSEEVEKNILRKTVTIYEYDPKIKIEAPIK